MRAMNNGFKENREKHHKGDIYLGIPYTEITPEGSIRLCAEFTMDQETQILYYEADAQWGQFFVTEYSDPFILAVVEKAMKHAYDIHFSQPMSEDLFYMLTTYTIPVYARNFEMFHEIDLYGNTTDVPVPTLGKAGTGFSAGVDSFYTVLKHMGNETCKNHNITHLLLALNGSASAGLCEEQDQEWLENSKNKFMPYAKELGMELICMGGNIDLLYAKDVALHGDTVVTASFVHAVRKLFGIYYWASTYPAEIFDFKPNDGGYHENISVSYVSVSGLRFYHSGSETNRVGKVGFIADYPIVQKCLTVCGEVEAQNCGCCVKCLRTMWELYAVGKLELFKESFPVDHFKHHFTLKLAKELAIDHAPFTTDIVHKMHENGLGVPLMAYPIAYCFYIPMQFLRKHLKRLVWLRRIYYHFNLDLKIGGRKQSAKERERKLNGMVKG